MLIYALFALAIVLVIVLVFSIYVAMQPSNFVITRSAVLPAPPEEVFSIVNDFHQWNHWSPWARLDPQCKNTFDGADSGVGAKFAWDGNNKVGAGSMEIVESRLNESLKIDLVFSKPMKANNLTLFTFRPEAGGTRVTWTMSGVSGFMGKLFGLLMNCDKMVGGQFDKGFDNMKELLDTGIKA